MVRLRREIDGVRRNYAIPLPGYAQDAEASAQVLPALDAWLRAADSGRVLLAGAPRRDLAEELAAAGQWVTVADLTDEQVRDWHGQLRPEVAAHLTLIARPYGEIAFGPAVFDRIALFDALTGYREPAWVVSKAARELKPDGFLAVRTLLTGPAPATWAADGAAPALRWQNALLHRTLDSTQTLLRRDFAQHLLDPAALDAIDRGAHLQDQRFAMDAAQLQSVVAAVLQVEQVWVAPVDRTRACNLQWGARPVLRAALSRVVRALPQQAATSELRADSASCVGLIARRALAGGVRFE